MQRFAVVLFAFVALFAIVAPSSVNALSHVKRDTNGDRLARGLPPRGPSRRSTAKRHEHSQVSVPHSGRIQCRGSNGQSLGYLQNAASGPNGINPGNNPEIPDLSVTYTPKDHSITCVGSQFSQGGSFLGGSAGDLKAGSPSYVHLTNGDNGDQSFTSPKWLVGQDGKISAQWENSDGSTSPVSCVYSAAQNTFAITGDSDSFCSQNSGWQPVSLYMVN